MEKGSELVLETLELIENNKASPISQRESDTLKDAPKLTPENTRIDWLKPGNEIESFIRGLSPYPVAWSILRNNGEELKMKIYDAIFEKEEHNLEPGTIQASKKDLKVACLNGSIIIKELQLPGKRKMDVISLLNGFSFSEDCNLM